jgi:hypothetical protein
MTKPLNRPDMLSRICPKEKTPKEAFTTDAETNASSDLLRHLSLAISVKIFD